MEMIPGVVQWAIIGAVITLIVALIIAPLRHSKPINDTPLPTAEGEYIPSDGDEGDGKGYYAREQRAMRKADAIQQRMGASGRMTAARLRSSTRRLNDKRRE